MIILVFVSNALQRGRPLTTPANAGGNTVVTVPGAVENTVPVILSVGGKMRVERGDMLSLDRAAVGDVKETWRTVRKDDGITVVNVVKEKCDDIGVACGTEENDSEKCDGVDIVKRVTLLVEVKSGSLILVVFADVVDSGLLVVSVPVAAVV